MQASDPDLTHGCPVCLAKPGERCLDRRRDGIHEPRWALSRPVVMFERSYPGLGEWAAAVVAQLEEVRGGNADETRARRVAVLQQRATELLNERLDSINPADVTDWSR